MPSARSRTCAGLDQQRADRRLQRGGLDVGARRRPRDMISPARPATTSPTNHVAPPGEVDHPDLAQRGGEAAIVAELLGELDRAAIGLLGAVEVDLVAAPPNDSPSGLRSSAWPSSRFARSSVAASPRSRGPVRTRRASSAAASSS